MSTEPETNAQNCLVWTTSTPLRHRVRHGRGHPRRHEAAHLLHRVLVDGCGHEEGTFTSYFYSLGRQLVLKVA